MVLYEGFIELLSISLIVIFCVTVYVTNKILNIEACSTSSMRSSTSDR